MTRPTSGERHSHMILAIVLLSAYSLSALMPTAQVAAFGAPLLVIAAELMGGRFSYAILTASTLFGAYHVGPFLTPAASLVALVAVRLLSYLRCRDVRIERRGLAAILLVLVTLAAQVVWRPETPEGRFVGNELLMVWLFLAAVHIRRPKEKNSWVPTVCVLLIVGIIAGFSTDAMVASDAYAFSAGRQVAGPYGGSNYVAALLVICATAAWANALLVRRWRATSMMVGFGLVVLALPLASRTSSIALLVALLLTAALSGRRAQVVGGLALCYFAALAVSNSQLLLGQRLSAGLESGLSTSGRFDLWSQTLGVIVQHPILGIGPGRLTDELQQLGEMTNYAHQLVLSLVAQYGIVLGAVGVVLLVARGSSKSDHVTLALTGPILLVACFEPSIETLRLGVVFIAITAASRSMWEERRVEGDRYRTRDRALQRP